MKRIQAIFFLQLIILVGCKDSKPNQSERKSEKVEKIIESKRTVSFTFDDGNTSDLAGFEFEEWNKMMLTHLKEENLKAIFFVTGNNKLDEKGKFLLKSWDDEGHRIANHSFSHPNFNFEQNNSHLFETELKRTDSIISKLTNSIKLFRFPYLKEGQNPSKVDSIRKVLADNNYENGYVTIDASDWYIDQRLISRIKDVGLEKAEIDQFRDFYLEHIMNRANYYEKLSYAMNGRPINHTLLLHHNLASALFLDDLIKEFKANGWELINAETAYEDKIFKEIPDHKYAGESLIYSMAKQSEKYAKSLRYPAEDSRYERKRMNELGL